MNIITPNMVENAVNLLKTAPDGTQANTQARNKAIKVLLSHSASLERFANLKPSGRVHDNVMMLVQEYSHLAGR